MLSHQAKAVILAGLPFLISPGGHTDDSIAKPRRCFKFRNAPLNINDYDEKNQNSTHWGFELWDKNLGARVIKMNNLIEFSLVYRVIAEEITLHNSFQSTAKSYEVDNHSASLALEMMPDNVCGKLGFAEIMDD